MGWRPEGLPPDGADFRLHHLLCASLQNAISGVGLKDEGRNELENITGIS